MTQDIAPTDGAGPREMLATLRPQAYAAGSPARVRDPIVEPLWSGLRTLAAIGPDGAAIVDEGGGPVDGMEAIAEALAVAARSDALVLDRVLTKQTTHRVGGVYAWSEEMPSMGKLVGIRRNRAEEASKEIEASLDARTFGPDDEVSFVATDLLWLDDTSLLDIPLLERRRLLEAVIEESDAVRVGPFVRPPIERWIGSWRAQGFAGITYKAANSRYLPGAANPDWIVTGMPRR